MKRIVLVALTVLALSGCAPASTDAVCDPGQLGIEVQPREDADPALVVVDVLLKNTSGSGCHLEGVPAVAITGAVSGTAIGGPAQVMDGTPEVVALPPGAAAFILVQTVKSIEDTPSCIGEIANSLRVVLPGGEDADAIVSSSPVAKYCDEPARGTLRVSPITAEPLVVDGVADFVAPRWLLGDGKP